MRWERPTDPPWLPWQPEMAGDGGRGSTGGRRGRRRERGRIKGRERLGRTGSGSSGPDEAVRAGLPRTGHVGALLCARTGSCGAVPVHATRCVRAGCPPRHTCGSYRLPSEIVLQFTSEESPNSGHHIIFRAFAIFSNVQPSQLMPDTSLMRSPALRKALEYFFSTESH